MLTIGQDSPNNAILVPQKLMTVLRSALKRDAEEIDKLSPNAEILDFVVNEMYSRTDEKLYYTGNLDMTSVFKWYGTEMSRTIQNDLQIVNKGRYVAGCIMIYLYGDFVIGDNVLPSRLIRPRSIQPDGITRIQQAILKLDAAKNVDSKFIPGTGERQEKS